MTWVQMNLNIEWGTITPSSGYVLKAYLPGTTTSTSIAIDQAGSSPQASITTNAEGKFEVSGNEILPFIDRAHKWALFTNATDAAANTNPFAGFYDNIDPLGLGEASLGTVADMVASVNLAVGDIITTAGYLVIGDTGDNVYEIVAAGTGTDDGGTFIDLDTLQAQAVFPEQVNVRQWGISPTTAPLTNATRITLADAYAASTDRPLNFSGGLYPVTLGTTALTISTSWIGVGAAHVTIQRFDFGILPTFGSNFAKANLVDDIVMSGITFDGQLTTVAMAGTPNQDLGAVGSYNDNTTESLWTESFGLIFVDCNNLLIEQCNFLNFLRSGPKVSTAGVAASSRTSINVTVRDCYINRSRGIFGDSIFLENVEGAVVQGNRCYDFTRIGIVLEQNEIIANESRDAKDTHIIGNHVEFGHDAVTTGGGTENNTGYWVEAGDNVHIGGGNVAKDVACGYVLSENPQDDTGDERPFGSLMALTNCSSVDTRIGAYLVHNKRGGKIAVDNCFFQSDSSAAPNSFLFITDSNDGQQGGIKINSLQAAGFTDVRSSIDIANTHIECGQRGLGGAAGDVYGAILITAGSAASFSDVAMSFTNISTTWLDSVGQTDTQVEANYQAGGPATPGNFFGAYGDLVFGGGDETPTNDRFDGFLLVDNWVNQSQGYCMIAASLDNANAEIKVVNSRISIRTADTNKAKWLISNCPLVDWRRNWNSESIFISDSVIIDADTSAVDRTVCVPTRLKITGGECRRQLVISNNGNVSASIRPTRLEITGVYFNIDTKTESMIKLSSANPTYSRCYISGNRFQHKSGSGAMVGAEHIIELSVLATTFIFLSGAGNDFDGFVSHVTQQDTVPTYNDLPNVAAYPYDVAVGAVVTMDTIA